MLHARGVNQADVASMLKDHPRRFFLRASAAEGGELTNSVRHAQRDRACTERRRLRLRIDGGDAPCLCVALRCVDGDYRDKFHAV
jgi:hypothetical protein